MTDDCLGRERETAQLADCFAEAQVPDVPGGRFWVELLPVAEKAAARDPEPAQQKIEFNLFRKMELEIGGYPAHALLFAADGADTARLHLQKNGLQKLKSEEIHLFHDSGKLDDAAQSAHLRDQTVDFRRPDEGAAGEGEIKADAFEFFHQAAAVVEGERFADAVDPVLVQYVGFADQEKREPGAVDMVVDAVFRLLFG